MNQPATELTWKSLGECLANSRRKQKMELRDAATALRLPSRTLSAIEQGHCDGLPGIYLKGHIQRYISLLNRNDHSLDGLCAEALFSTLPTGQNARCPLPTAIPAAPARRLFDNALRIASYVVVTAGVVIPLVWWFTQGAVRMSFDESLVSSSVPVQEGEVSSSDSTAVASIRPGHFNASAAPFASMSPASQTPAGQGAVLNGQTMLTGALSANATTAQPLQPPYRPLPQSQQPDAVRASSESAAIAPAGDLLQLRLLNDSWVEITDADGERVEFDLLRTGQLHQYQVNLPLDILIGKASAVDVLLNGVPVDLSPYTRGNVAKLTLADLPPATEPPAD